MFESMLDDGLTSSYLLLFLSVISLTFILQSIHQNILFQIKVDLENSAKVGNPLNTFIETAEKNPTKEPIVHQVPHVIDRATGQPLLVNIQPSQVAKVVIPQGGTQALIFGDTNEPHISGQYFDDPSPHPDTDGLALFGNDRVSVILQEQNFSFWN